MTTFFQCFVIGALLAIIWIMQQLLRELRETRRAAKLASSLLRDTRSHQGSIGTARTNGSATPVIERARQVGPRHPLPRTGKQSRALKFVTKGGPDDGDAPDSGFQPYPGAEPIFLGEARSSQYPDHSPESGERDRTKDA